MNRNLDNCLHLSGVIRQLRPSDLPKFRDHLLRLDATSRRERFNGLVHDRFISAYAYRSFAAGTTIIAYLEGDEVLGAAEIHERAGTQEPTAEIAFSVEPHLQHRGLGRLLFAQLIEKARDFGYTKLLISTTPQNAPMRALARRYNAHLAFQDGETLGNIDLDPLMPLSVSASAGKPERAVL
ncbi:GNAT family N-acetyltransferase [Aquamicrobium segne]|uniref:GNAT family N-acetyltransferase n=1 Tax=Aquamicrobium segne TaxID=469547 RepID=A0ABW0GY51_9HYPH